MRDRTTKLFLILIAIALWGILLRPLITLPTTQAETTGQRPSDVPVAITYGDGFVFVATQRGYVHRFNGREGIWLNNAQRIPNAPFP